MSNGCDAIERRIREFIMNSIISDYVSRKVVGKEGVSYHIRLIVDL